MRILLISYYFAPFNSVGAVRPCKLAEYLHSQGHEVHVLAGKNQPFPTGLATNFPDSKVVYSDDWSINAPIEFLLGGRKKIASQGFVTGNAKSIKHKLGMLYKTLTHWPDGQIGWVSSAVKDGLALLRNNKYDVIYASAPPFSSFRVAKILSDTSGVPWVAELRDLWSDNHNYQYPAWRRWIERQWEHKLLSSASALVTVSGPLLSRLTHYKVPKWEIRNGFDSADYLDTLKPSGFLPENGGLNIVFTGNIYPEHYDLACFCKALAKYKTVGGNALVHVVGRNGNALLRSAELYGVGNMISYQPTVKRPLAMGMQVAADVLLTFLWEGGREEGIYSTKLFEYAGAKRPILAIGGCKSDIGALIKNAGIGEAFMDADEISRHLMHLLQIKLQNGELKTTPNENFDFSRRSQFQMLELKLTALIKNSYAQITDALDSKVPE